MSPSSSTFDDHQLAGNESRELVDVTKFGALERHIFIEKLIQNIEHDNLQLLQKIRKRLDRVGIELPSIEVRYNNLLIEAECEVVSGKALPTLWNSFKSAVLDFTRLLPGFKSGISKINIIDGVSGIIKPGRMTLLLGPPGCGKTTLLKALSGNLSKSLKVLLKTRSAMYTVNNHSIIMYGDITYNGYKMNEFVPQKTSAYISQYDLHTGEMTVRETLDFSLQCQGVGNKAEILTELIRREKDAGITPDPDVDAYMKGSSIEGKKTTLQADYILRILGLDTCADTLVGDEMRRGISGGEKKRLTTGEMIVGPTRALFMDEISNGLDSSTTYQIVAFLQQLAHLTDATILVSLLQPAPETFDLFDDIILMGEGKVVYHGPRTQVLEFIESVGFSCPERKGVADFLQEVISRKDQAQYWHSDEATRHYFSIDMLSERFKQSSYGKRLSGQLSTEILKSKSHKDAITFTAYSLPKWDLFKTCLSKEFLLMKRNSFIYVFKLVQMTINAIITMTLFMGSRTKVDLMHSNYYMGALFYALTMLVTNGLPELELTVARLAVFYKHRDLSFYPAWAYAISSAILKIPLSFLESLVFTCLTYYVIGYTPEIERFLVHLAIQFAVHMTATSMYRFIASAYRTVVAATMVGDLALLYAFLFSGFTIPNSSMPNWLKWGIWASPFTYGEIALNVNEFTASRWRKMLPSNISIGQQALDARGLNFKERFVWISIGALLGFNLLFNIGFTLALTFLHPARSRAIISQEKFSRLGKSIKTDALDQDEKHSRFSLEKLVARSQQGGE
ncbi:OLC1v1008347C1 [Oldenlandia corymbosa var. corymbosa]|uniref:OLC1v1008347C1 n=1 Tax=Oldenlandia corymbosa var. corymbosa TaxID=529605 RepID=A0AAV1DLK0_OLDCO|nr:OLC1v1008347C1 [Oldenlandia corymbosa var. corymbosa]